ncbi:site-2 protease family protein [bacterium]|nr:MAG: site-2 protease family protein [bacterium]
MDPAPQDPQKQATGSPWSFRIATIEGIPIRLHITFLLFLTYIAFVGQNRGGLIWPLFVIAVFACVLLHELGHALAAKKYDVHTRDITLYPIGGIAMLEGRPTAKQELVIAIAGPLVNVVIAVALGVGLYFSKGTISISSELKEATFLPTLFMANVTLALFNLIPAFPMDGGRVLRSILALNMPEVKATQIAAFVGQSLAIVLFVYALFSGQVVLALVAFFVFLGAGQELAGSVTRSLLEGHKASDAMQSRFRTIESGATMEMAAEMLLAGSQYHFPVTVGDEIVGTLSRTGIAQGLSQGGPSAYVAGYMQRGIKTTDPDVPLERIAEAVTDKEDPSPVLVMEEGRLIGIITQDNLSEFIMLENARRSSGRPASA